MNRDISDTVDGGWGQCVRNAINRKDNRWDNVSPCFGTCAAALSRRRNPSHVAFALDSESGSDQS